MTCRADRWLLQLMLYLANYFVLSVLYIAVFYTRVRTAMRKSLEQCIGVVLYRERSKSLRIFETYKYELRKKHGIHWKGTGSNSESAMSPCAYLKRTIYKL